MQQHYPFINLLDLPQELSKRLNEISKTMDPIYQNFIDKISKENLDNLDWWVSETATRNTSASFLFKNLCYLELIKDILSYATIGTIETDSYPLTKHLNVFIKEKNLPTKVIYKASIKNRLRNTRIFNLYLYMRLICLISYKVFVIKRYFSSFEFEENKDYTMLSIFMLQNSIQNNCFHDRYFIGIMNYLTPEQKEGLVFCPTFHQITGYKQFIKDMNACDTKFVIPEYYLSFRDLLYIFCFPLRLKRLKYRAPIIFNGDDISSLFRMDLLKSRFNKSSWQGIIKYRFSNQLSKYPFNLKRLLVWFENQSHDKGLFLGTHRFLKQTKTAGYQGSFFYQHYFCFRPTISEFNAKVIPQVIYVNGIAQKTDIKEYCPHLTVNIAPSLRMQPAWRNKKRNHKTTVIIGLPMSHSDAQFILKHILSIIDTFCTRNITFLAKLHPSVSSEDILHSWPDSIQLSTCPFNELLDRGDIFVGMHGSTPVESLASNLKVILLAKSSDIFHNPFPKSVSKNLYSVCFSPKETFKQFQQFQNQSDSELSQFFENTKQINQLYFEPVTKSGVQNLMGI